MSQKVRVVLEVTSKGMNAFSKANGQLQRFDRNVRETFSKLANIQNVIAGAAFVGLSRSILKADMAMQGIENRLDAAIGKFTSTSEELKYIRSEADRMGISFQDLSQSYAGFSASATRAGLQLKDVREIFKNVAETSVSLSLSGDKTRMVFLALEQMASKGKVSMEELRRQLGEHLPGALEIAARSMGMTTSQFNKAISNGEVFAYDFLPKFARAVREELGGSFERASTQLIANTARMKTALFNFRQKAGEALNPIVNDLLPQLISMLEGLASKQHEIRIAMNGISASIRILWNGFQIVSDGVAAALMYMYKAGKIFFIQFFGWIDLAGEAIISFVKSLGRLIAILGELKDNPFSADDILKSTDWNNLLTPFESVKTKFYKIGTDTKTQFDDLIGIWKLSVKEYDKNMNDIADAMVKAEANIADAVEKSRNKNFQKITPPKIDKDDGKGKKKKYYSLKTGHYDPDQAWMQGLKSPVTTPLKFAMPLDFNKKWKEDNKLLVADQKKTLQQVYDQLMAFNVKVMTNEEVFAERRKELWKDQSEYIQYTMKNAFMTLVDLEGTFTEKVQSILRGFYSMSMSMLYDWLSEYVKAKMYEASVGIATEKAVQTENITTTATAGAAAAANSGKSVASIPYVGPVLAIAAIAAVFGSIISLIAKAKKFAIGTRYAPSGPMIVGERGPEMMMARGGERIISNDKMGSIGGNTNININVSGNMDKETAKMTISEMKKFAQTYYNASRLGYIRASYAR